MSRPSAPKRRRLSPPEDDAPAPGHQQSFLKSAAKWDLEQDYENRPRRLDKKKKKGQDKLPVRTTEGWVALPAAPVEVKDEEVSDSFLGSGSEGDEEEAEEEKKAPKIPARQQILEAKEELARIASLVNEDPEEHIGALKTLAAIAESENNTVKKLALATSVTIFKDLIPGYRIRPIAEEAMGEKVSREVKKLRHFEQKLVSGYETYVKQLAALCKLSGSSDEQKASLATVAVSCACNLLTAVPHFNFRNDLLKIMVGKLSTRRVDADFVRCREAVEKLFAEDEDGNVSLEGVTLLTKMMKAKHYNFDESALNTFLHLRLLSDFHRKASYNSVDKDEEDTVKKIKQKREFRTKRLRKDLKEKKAIAKEFKEADAAVSHEERDRMQAETLKLVFVCYFRILKARSPKLMGAVLEGLARYAHLINQDFFGDILEALRDIIATAEISAAAEVSEDEDAESDSDDDEAPERNLSRESLLCVITAFALLEGQDVLKQASTLKLDLTFFITHLYRTLHPVSVNADIELSAKSLHLPDPGARENPHAPSPNKINVQTTIVLLIRSLSSVLLPATALRGVPPIRVAAFTKQLMSISLQLPEKSCIAMLGLLNRVARAHGKKVAPLWNTEERRGDGVFDPLKAEFEGSNAFAATVWEGELLRRHYAPAVQEALKGIEGNVKEALKG
ncbi:nucleolar complex-associated protein-domain-containing protein [Boeremia exigua]|uniref:nucleolar complex-associated protein-domain-containing protein n=1 Tax=Boeremia exigua TaxID=749465 RepID=UPI001E8E9D35|nr:nucleolar complex-associated protein-domain-containing protein [Boeremia exigua]KAH6625570.1 nucleolar complex-associated protein-domain-containing protein [Boeremia exigua]